jgi:dihydroflavonol-4-reductase
MIFVTGATGHLGNALVRKLLNQGEKVRALIWRGEDTPSIRDLDIERVEGDVLDPASLQPALDGVDTIYHLAGIISIMPEKTRSCGRNAQHPSFSEEPTSDQIF